MAGRLARSASGQPVGLGRGFAVVGRRQNQGSRWRR